MGFEAKKIKSAKAQKVQMILFFKLDNTIHAYSATFPVTTPFLSNKEADN